MGFLKKFSDFLDRESTETTTTSDFKDEIESLCTRLSKHKVSVPALIRLYVTDCIKAGRHSGMQKTEVTQIISEVLQAYDDKTTDKSDIDEIVNEVYST